MNTILVLKFPYSSVFGGGEQHTLHLVAGLQEKGFTCYYAGSCAVLLREFRQRRWPRRRWWAGPEPVSIGTILVWPLLAAPAGFGLALLLLYYRLFRRVRVLYCLTLTEKLLGTLPARLLGMKVVWVEHVTIERWLTQNPLRLLYRWLSRLVTVVAVSQAVQRQLTELIHVRPGNAQVIYHGIDCSHFTPKEYRWEGVARFNVGCIARLEREKGIEYLIQAIKIVKEFVPVVRLIIVGEGTERKKLVWLAARLGLQESIQWVGHQRDVATWYHYFDAYVLPSVKRESFGLTLVESMASGVPVIGSRLGGIPEIIEHQVNGLLTAPGSSQDIADQLMYLYNNRGEVGSMVRRARQTVEQRFSRERMLRDYYLLLRK
ncbi:MAG: glycosyltransferase family 4 protein [Patescibacteria group bacterium]